MARETMDYDVVVVGAGPSGLAAAIRLKQLAQAAGRALSVCIVEKGAEVGSHILSGNVFEPRALDELLPEWRTLCTSPSNSNPVTLTPVTSDSVYFLTSRYRIPLPVPPSLHNTGNYIISLSQLCKFLSSHAE